jgi:hypothetical protein
MRVDDYFYMRAVERRACKVIYAKFGINQFEFNVLLGLSAFLTLYGRKIVGRKQLVDWIGLDYKAEKKANGYFYGLEIKGAIHRLGYRRSFGNCMAVSPFGLKVLEHFETIVSEMESQARKERPKGLTYKDLLCDPDNLPQGYTMLNKGREN